MSKQFKIKRQLDVNVDASINDGQKALGMTDEEMEVLTEKLESIFDEDGQTVKQVEDIVPTLTDKELVLMILTGTREAAQRIGMKKFARQKISHLLGGSKKIPFNNQNQN